MDIKKRSHRLRALGLALVASLAIAATSAASASALSFTWEPKEGPAVLSVSSPATLFGTAGSSYDQVSCKTTSGTATFVSEASGNVKLTLQGCTIGPVGFTVNCSTPGQPSGTILTSELPVYPVYLDAGKTKFGLQIGNQGALGSPATGSTWASEINCSGIRKFKWNGSVLSQVTSPGLNVSASAFSVSLSGSGETQQYEWVEGNTEIPFANFRHLSQSADGGKSYVGMSMSSGMTWAMTGGKKGKFIP
jgi:hypothetical protein